MSDLNVFTLIVFFLVALAITATVFCYQYLVTRNKQGASYQPYLPAAVLLIDRHGVKTTVMCPLKAWSSAIPGVECYDVVRQWRIEPSDYYAGVFTRIPRSSV